MLSFQFPISIKGWQEPGLWRPKFILERYFDEDEGEGFKERIYFKLKNDKTIQVFKPENRPKFELFKPKREIEMKKKLFVGTNDDDDVKSTISNRKQEERRPIDGSWDWKNGAPMEYSKLQFQIVENGVKVRHECRFKWGKLDGYAPLFKEGKILKPSQTGPPLATYNAGTFVIKVSPHRPIISKDYLAYQQFSVIIIFSY